MITLADLISMRSRGGGLDELLRARQMPPGRGLPMPVGRPVVPMGRPAGVPMGRPFGMRPGGGLPIGDPDLMEVLRGLATAPGAGGRSAVGAPSNLTPFPYQPFGTASIGGMDSPGGPHGAVTANGALAGDAISAAAAIMGGEFADNPSSLGAPTADTAAGQIAGGLGGLAAALGVSPALSGSESSDSLGGLGEADGLGGEGEGGEGDGDGDGGFQYGGQFRVGRRPEFTHRVLQLLRERR
jgi:hypothetical protein